MTASFMRMFECSQYARTASSCIQSLITSQDCKAKPSRCKKACWCMLKLFFFQGDLVLFQRRFCCSGDPDFVSWSEWCGKARPLHAWICNLHFSRNDWLIMNHLQHLQRETGLWWKATLSQWTWGLASCDLFCEPLSRGVGSCISTASQAWCGSSKLILLQWACLKS